MTDNSNQPKARRAAIGGGLSAAALAALALATPAIKHDEGKRNSVYLDSVQLPTVCFGHMDRGMKVGTKFSDEKCDDLLAGDTQRMIGGVLACSPDLDQMHHVPQLAAAVRFTFNAGPVGYCRSSIARNFNAGKFKEGCTGLLAYNGVIASRPVRGNVGVRRLSNGKYFSVLPGLVNRRKREYAECMTGVV